VRELARRLGLEVRTVYADAKRLVAIGLIAQAEDGKLLFPYDRVEVRLGWRAAA
jgi:predicted transcriptional regulator